MIFGLVLATSVATVGVTFGFGFSAAGASALESVLVGQLGCGRLSLLDLGQLGLWRFSNRSGWCGSGLPLFGSKPLQHLRADDSLLVLAQYPLGAV